ncbi:hypothetical protein [Saccharothrix sp. NRRL B-16348]|uniref:hypothetical protein n=1 Tax=Saccharothrix sp. NRRL B-16348 TaxID=1415542 RepID=UPI000B0A3BEC|nr:hypothetical protein [Saccharothrix sp. NRRL B-16348]
MAGAFARTGGSGVKVSLQLDALPWHDIPDMDIAERGHGRTERRTFQVPPAS